MSPIPLSERQRKIAEIVRQEGPVAGETIARELGLSRAALRSDLAILTMSGILDARPRVGYFYTGKNTLGLLQEELSSITVEDIKSVPIVVSSEKSAYDAAITMFLEDVGTVFVVEGPEGLLHGVVSRKDLLKAALNPGSDLHQLPVAMVMTPLSKIVTASPEEPAASEHNHRKDRHHRNTREQRADARSQQAQFRKAQLTVNKDIVAYDVQRISAQQYPHSGLGIRNAIRKLLETIEQHNEDQ